MEKFCIDCRHLIRPQSGLPMDHARCRLTRSINLVTGEIKYRYCDTMRTEIGKSDCGPDAKQFQPMLEVA